MKRAEAKKVIDTFKWLFEETLRRYPSKETLATYYIKAFKTASEALDEDWIPVSIREATPEELEENPNITFYYTGTMPDLYQRVLVTTKSSGVDVTELCEGDFGVYFDNYDEDDIVAWMPYPKPYMEE